MAKQLWTARSTFIETELEKDGSCTVCKKEHKTGSTVLFKQYGNSMNRTQKVRIILCNDECHQEYDFRYWEKKIEDRRDENSNYQKRRRNRRHFIQ